MSKEIKSDKLVYRMEEVSRIAKLDLSVIEAWEKEFYFLNAGQTGSGKRIFRKKDLAIILRIKELVDKEGMTLAGAKRKIELEFGLKGSAPIHPEKLKKTLFQIRTQLKDISVYLDSLKE